MDKNKNRTDLLAAGRKKLQQFRQKKDNKGSKSSNKSGKSERNDNATSTKEAATSHPVREGKRSMHDADASSESLSKEEDSTVGNIDVVTVVDQLPPSGIAETIAETIVESGPERERSRNNADDAIPSESHSRKGDSYIDVATVVDPPLTSETAETIAESTIELLSEGERSFHDADDAIAASELISREEDSTVGNIDVAAVVDPPPASEIADTIAETSLELSEDPGMGQANLNPNLNHEFPGHMSSPDQEGDTSVVAEDEISTNSNMQPVVDAKEQSAESGVPLSGSISSQVGRQYEERQNPDDPGLIQDDETSDFKTGEDKKPVLPESDGHLARSSVITGLLQEEVVSESSKEKQSNSLSADNGCENSEETHEDTLGKNTLMEGSSGLKSDLSEKDLGRKMVTLNTGSETSLITMSQLAEVIRKLDEEELRFLCSRKESSAAQLINSDGVDVPLSERVKEHLYLATFAKDAVDLQLNEQLDIQSELSHQHHQFVDKMSMTTALLDEVQGKNHKLAEELAQCRSQLQEVVSMREDLQKQLNDSRSELENSSARVNELQNELEISQSNLLGLSSELDVCRNSLEALQTENGKLLQNLHLVTEEKEQVVVEKKHLVLENERLASELAQCRLSLDSLQSENVNTSKNVALLREENSKIDEEKQYFVTQNDKLLAELADSKIMMETLQLENAKLNASVSEERTKIDVEKENLVSESDKVATESVNCLVLVEALRMEISSINRILAPVADVSNRLEEEKMYLSSENEKLAHEVTDCKALVMGLQAECTKAVDDLKEAALRIEQLVEENVYLKSNVENHKVKITEHDDRREKSSRFEDLGNALEDLSAPSTALEDLIGHIKEAENVMQKLEQAIEVMHSDSATSKTSGKVVTAGVSKLIQAFESKEPVDDHESGEQVSSGSQSTEDPFKLSKEQTLNLKAVLQKLLIDAENATKVVEDERKSTILANTSVSELNACYVSLKDHSDHLEAANIELMTFSEVLRQHICDFEAKEGELVTLYEASQKQEVTLKAENSKLAVKLCDLEGKVGELQSQLDEAYQRSDEMLASFSNQFETLHEVVASREVAFAEEWNSIVTEICLTVEKLDTSVATFGSVSDDSLDIKSRVVASVDAATKVIENLKGQIEAACKDHETVLSTYNELNKEFIGLQGQNDRAVDMLHKIYGDLIKLVIESGGFVEETTKEKFLDPQASGIFDTLIEQVEVFLRERLVLESENRKLSSELIDRARDVDELNHKCLSSDSVLKLLEDLEQEYKLEETGSKIDEPMSRLESLIYYLVWKYKEADEQVNLFREMHTSKKEESTDVLGQIDHLSFILVEHEIEIVVLEECLKSAKDTIVAVQSELQEKVTELDLSEQRVLSLREKLSMAVTKGKGLIVQRDSLKKSLAETSNDLEKSKQEVQAKDARTNELEIKLKAYMEAGERMEALESELSYIRNSATALRESFLLKDSVLQRIEEILEDLELPEHFHSGDIIDKVDWLAKSVSGNSLPLTDWDHKSSVGGGSYSDAGLAGMDGWKEEAQLGSNTSDEYRRRYEELQSKFYGLAEQNEMLEQSLVERNNLVQRWEEILGRIDVPSQLRSMEPEVRIAWLISALSEAHNHCTFLQEKNDNLEASSASLTADVEESQRRISELDTAMQLLITEKETLSKDLEILTRVYGEMSKKAAKLETDNGNLQKDVSALQDRLNMNYGLEERIQYFEGGLRKFEDMVKGVLQDSGAEDQAYGSDNVEYFEGLLRKLLEKHVATENEDPTSGADRTRDLKDKEEEVALLNKKLDEASDEVKYLKDERDRCMGELAVLNKKLDDSLGESMHLKEERDKFMESNNSLVCEVEALETKVTELQQQLIQEEQKSASIKEKLNVAVRKGKSLVQQRDSMKQYIEETNSEMERLKSLIGHHESTISEYANKMKDLATLHEKIESLESENTFLRDRTAESDRSLQEKEHTLSMILNSLGHIDVGLKTGISDPVERLGEIETLFSSLRASLVTSQQESSKSKRAAELLLAELNEVQERNDTLQEELATTATELSELAKERDNYFAEVMQAKSISDQLRDGLASLEKLIGHVLSKDLGTLRNLEACIKSCLQSNDAPNFVALLARGVPGGIISAESGNKVSMKEIGSLKEQLKRHLDLLREESSRLTDVLRFVHTDMTSQNEYCESLKKEIKRLESVENEKDSELLIAHSNFSLLCEACTSSIAEVEKWKAELVARGFAAGAPGDNFDSQATNFTKESFSSEEGVRTLREKLSSVVKDLISMQGEVFEVNQKDMRSTILHLQKELQEKDIQRERNCMELVSQIKEAEAVAKNHLQELQRAQARIEDLEKEASGVHEERILLEKRTKELQDRDASLKELEQRNKSLTDTLTAKEQENEALLQALDEEEAQMEELTNKNAELERVLQQKNQDLENLDTSRGKIIKKLSVTVGKFDELHNLSENLLAEVEKLQSQLQDRDSEISFLRQELTRCANDALNASQISQKRNSDEVSELLTWLDTIISGVQARDLLMDGVKPNQVDEYKEIIKEQVMSVISELEDLRMAAQKGDVLLQSERAKVEELTRKEQYLESSLRGKESELAMLHGDSGQVTTTSSEIVEMEPMINKWTASGPVIPQVRSLRKTNNDHVAIAIDVDSTSERLEEEDDDKAHGFKSLTTSRIVPRFTRPITDLVDGLWVTCDRTLMRQPALRICVIMYWALLHALLATYVV